MLEYRYNSTTIVAMGFSDSASVLTLLVSMHRTMVAQRHDLKVEARVSTTRAEYSSCHREAPPSVKRTK
jgi:hypothetical protein